MDGRPRRAENFDPEHLLAGDSKSRSLAAPCVFNTACVYLCVSARCSHPPADSPTSLLSARSLCNVFGLRRKWEQSFSVGCTEPVRCPGTCKLRVVAHPPRGREGNKHTTVLLYDQHNVESQRDQVHQSAFIKLHSCEGFIQGLVLGSGSLTSNGARRSCGRRRRRQARCDAERVCS